MTQIFTQLAGRFSRLRVGAFAPLAKRNWSLGGARANPNLRGLNPSQNMLDQLINALRRYRIRQQWQRDLRELDDRQLDDIGVSRAEAERTIERIRFWI
jgi:uncharacterized protein YjiS (DUF1127 family)